MAGHNLELEQFSALTWDEVAAQASPSIRNALERVLELLCDSFHYVILDVGKTTDPLAGDAFDFASRAYLISDRSVHSTRETIRLLRFIEDRDNNPPTSLLLNNPNAASAGKVQAAVG